MTPEPVYANGGSSPSPFSRSPSPSIALSSPAPPSPQPPSHLPILLTPPTFAHCPTTSNNSVSSMSINNLDLPRNLIILATPPTPTSVPPPQLGESEKPFKVQLSIPLTSPNLLLPPSPSSEPVSPAAPQTATLGYSSDPVSPCPQRMGGHYSSYKPNFHPYQNTLIKSEPSSQSSLQVS